MKKTLYSEEGQIIARAIFKIRSKANLTLRGLAEKLNRPHSIFSQIEKGDRRVDLAEFYSICEACEASPHKEAARIMKEIAKL